MKKHVLAFCLSFVLGTMMAANMGGRISMSVQYDQPSELQQPNRRMPASPIYVDQEDHTFTFNSGLAGETIEVVVGDEFLYTTMIGEDGKVVIPDNISGEVELRLYRGSLVYHAVVEL